MFVCSTPGAVRGIILYGSGVCVLHVVRQRRVWLLVNGNMVNIERSGYWTRWIMMAGCLMLYFLGML